MSGETSTQRTNGEATPNPEREWVEFEYQPPGLATAVALGASIVVVGALAPVWLYASLGAGLGAVVLAAGLVRGTRWLVTAGAAAMFVALVAAAITGEAVGPILAAAIATLVAFDAGRYGVQLGHHVGADGGTLRAELRHVGVTVGVSVAGGVIGLGVFFVAPAELPGLALFALVIAAVLFVSGLTLMDTGEDENE